MVIVTIFLTRPKQASQFSPVKGVRVLGQLLQRQRPPEDMGNHDLGGRGTPLRTVRLRPRTVEKGLGESLQ